MFETDSPVTRLCAAGMAVDGDPAAAHAFFLQAWSARRDDFDASVAAHFMARHQPTPAARLHWNRLAVQYAEAVPGNRAYPLLASLYLNLADSLLTHGDITDASAAAGRGVTALQFLAPSGYREFVAHGLERVQDRIRQAGGVPADI